MNRYIVMTSKAKMPSSVRVPYIHVAVVELEDGFEGTPKMISTRARGVRRIVRKWERQHLGRNPKGMTSAEVAIGWAHILANHLSSGISESDPLNQRFFN